MLITIARQYGAGGSEVAQRVAATLGWRVVDNDLVEQVAARAGLPAEEVARLDERGPSFIERLARSLVAATPELFSPGGAATRGAMPEFQEADLVRITETVVAEIAAQGNVVFVGRATPAVLATERDALHVRVVAPRNYRTEVIARRLGCTSAEAAKAVDETDARRARYYRQYYGRDWEEASNYHLVLNTAALGLDGAAEVIVRCVTRS